MEHVQIILPQPDRAALRDCIAEVFRSLDAHPRPLLLRLQLGAAGQVLAGPFPPRYIPEHPVPLKLSKRGRALLVLTPTTGNRVKVRLANLWERLFT